MKVRSSLKTLKTRHRDCKLVRRKGRVYVINKTNPRFTGAPGALSLFRAARPRGNLQSSFAGRRWLGGKPKRLACDHALPGRRCRHRTHRAPAPWIAFSPGPDARSFCAWSQRVRAHGVDHFGY